MGAKATKVKNRKYIGIIIFVLMLSFVCGAVFYIHDSYPAGEQAAAILEKEQDIRVLQIEKNVYAFIPENPVAGLIFYPGGKVEYEAYAPLMEAFADKGILCILPGMPANLAVFGIDRATGLKDEFPQITKWYMGGHSLGGAMAASYVSSYREEFAGLILLGAYSTVDLNGSDLRVISVYGSNDNVMNKAKYDSCRENLPKDTAEQVIEGGCHSYFGDYGMQKGDGTPSITHDEQINKTVEFCIEIMEQYDESTQKLIDWVGCPYKVFYKKSDPDNVRDAYKEAATRGKEEGFVPVIVAADGILDQWFMVLEEDGYRRENILKENGEKGNKILKKRYDMYKVINGKNKTENDIDISDYEIYTDYIYDIAGEEYGSVNIGGKIDTLSSFVSYEGNLNCECILFEIPVTNPWEVMAWLPIGGWNECPDAVEMLAICRYWYEEYGAVPAVVSHDAMEFVLEEPVSEKSVGELAKEHYAFCADLIDQSGYGCSEEILADSLSKATVWYFWWD